MPKLNHSTITYRCWTMIVFLMLLPGSLFAMPAEEHVRGAKSLLSASAKRGGAAELSEKALREIRSWMDEPVKRLGPHHGKARHGVDEVVEYFAKKGLDPDAVRNVARLHKIQDIAHNSLPVDGWRLTDDMAGEARRLLDYVDDYGRLPKRLPSWVDEPGKLLDDAAEGTARALSSGGDDAAKAAGRSVDDVVKGAAHSTDDVARASAPLAGRAARFVGKAAGPVAFVVEGGVRGYGSYQTEQKYRREEITNKERYRHHGKNAGQFAGGVGGAMAGAKAGAGAGGAVGALFGGVGTPVGAAAGGLVGAVGGALGGDYVGGKAGAGVGDALVE